MIQIQEDSSVFAWEAYVNPLEAWIVAGAIFVAVVAVGLAVRSTFLRRSGRLQPERDELEKSMEAPVRDALAKTRVWFLVLVALWASTVPLTLHPTVSRVISTAAVLALLAQIVIWANAALDSWMRRFERLNLETDAAAVTTIRALGFLIRLGLYAVVFLMALANLGVNITALIAGLGVGGIAVALAVQNILGDLFASLSIVLDKPFVVGDFIIVGELLGTVEYIGLKTTRVRSLSGEQLVFSNSDLLNSRIRNFKRMQQRRVVFEFGLVYQTRPEEIEEIPGIIREIIDAMEETRFDRAHFKAFGEHALTFEVVYFVLSADFNVYMDVQQHINLRLYRELERLGVRFAYPTRTVYLRDDRQAPATEPASAPA